MSTPATFVPATLPPPSTNKKSPPTLGSPWRQRTTKNYYDRQNYDDEQEEKKEAEMKADEYRLNHPLIPNPTFIQKSTSVYDSSLARDNRPQSHY